ncbi:hypothetical protein KP509_34G036600 [Ceratopteris richardii]|nr:hypothetical protein KP509_34G036600 [Ceratopteris richardii]
MEYMTAEIIARATGRKLCLPPFFNGPKKHTGRYPNGGLWMHERFDMNVLQKFVNLTSIDVCGKKCGMTVDAFWWMRRSSASMLPTYWKSSSTATTHDLGKYVRDWQSVDDMQRTFSEFDNVKERCVALGGLFPGLRWRGAYLAASKYMRPSPPIAEIVDSLQALAFGRDTNYLAVHWRFEESLCKGTEAGEKVGGVGLCFLRCGDAAVIDSGLHAEAMGLPALTKATLRSSVTDGDPHETDHTIHQTCRHLPDTTQVTISKTDLIAAILEKASTENVSSVYIATDGWLRGQRAQTLVKEVVQDIRIRGLKAAGLWRLPDLPNIILKGTDAQYVDQVIKSISNLELSGHILSKVEQEMCFRSKAFMGSGESTWSLVVFRERLAQRMVQKAFAYMKGAVDVDEDLIVSKLMEDSHAAGLQCRYRILFGGSHIRKSVPQEGYQDEAPDTWLDMEACEGQLHKSGSCILSDCFS